MTGKRTDPMRTARSKERVRGQKNGEKETASVETRQLLAKKQQTWQKREFCWRKKFHHSGRRASEQVAAAAANELAVAMASDCSGGNDEQHCIYIGPTGLLVNI